MLFQSQLRSTSKNLREKWSYRSRMRLQLPNRVTDANLLYAPTPPSPHPASGGIWLNIRRLVYRFRQVGRAIDRARYWNRDIGVDRRHA